MNSRLFPAVAAALLTCTTVGFSQEKPAPKPATPAAEEKTAPAFPPADLAKFTTADELWAYLINTGNQNPPRTKTQDEFMEMLQSWLSRQQEAAAEFIKRYPEDPRRWDATAVKLMTSVQLQSFSEKPFDSAAAKKEVEAVLNAPDATPAAKSEALYVQIQLLGEGADAEKPESLAPIQKAVSAFLDQFADTKRAVEIANMQTQLIQMGAVADPTAVLKKMSESKNPKVAEVAKRMIDQAAKMADLRSKPLDLKFTAADGKEFDIAKLRGKVVLVDFWASWCGPCIAEMPNVVAAYKKLKSKGFEIVGISLDQEKPAMEAALKKHDMTWPQYFDGQGWQNKISSAYGIESIPATWLVDKKGMVRETDLRGEELAKGVEKLLAE